MSQNIFEMAVVQKFRFNTPQGQITAEDLFDLPLQSNTGRANLDSIAIDLHNQLKKADTNVSFVTEIKSEATNLQARFDLVKYVIEVKIAARDKAQKAKETRERNQKILALIEQKENAAMADKSLDELRALLTATEA